MKFLTQLTIWSEKRKFPLNNVFLTASGPFFLRLGLMYFCRFCPKHREQQAIERAKVKEHITTTNSQSFRPKVTSEASSPKKSSVDKQIYKSKSTSKDNSSKSQKPAMPRPLTSPRKSVSAIDIRCKLPNASPAAASPGLKNSRRDTPSTYARPRPSVNSADEDEHDSPKRARTSKNNMDTAEEFRVLKEYRFVSKPL